MQEISKTKIVATIGPASASAEVLSQMFKEGMDVARINGAHGSDAEHRRTIALIRKTAKKLRCQAAILVDLPGPKYRVGKLIREPLALKTGGRATLVCGSSVTKRNELPIPHNIHLSVKPGAKIFINDGIVELKVLSVRGRKIECAVLAGGEIRSHKGINLPGTKLDAPSLTALDKKILDFAIREGVDYIGLSFVRSAKDVTALRKILRRRAPRTGIVAKIEKPEALCDLENIIAESDAIMVARGDLGIEMPFDQIPLIQKHIIEECRRFAKPCITATQMLESMVSASRPTRAEVTDVAGAVWEGSDAVMLSEETSIGNDPANAVKVMARIAHTSEEQVKPYDVPRGTPRGIRYILPLEGGGYPPSTQQVECSAGGEGDRCHPLPIPLPRKVAWPQRGFTPSRERECAVPPPQAAGNYLVEYSDVKKDPSEYQAQVVCRSAGFIADNLGAKAIVAPTRTGRTPLYISQNRPNVLILAPTEDEKTARKMCLYRGVLPMMMPRFKTVDEMLSRAEKAALKSGLIKKGDTIVIASGAHGRKGGITRLVEVRRV